MIKIAPKDILPTLMAGLLIGIIDTIVSISFATLIFSGDLSPYAGRGIGLALVSATVAMLVIGILSQIDGILSVPQDVPTVIFAVIAAQIAGHSAQPQSEATFWTVVVAIGLTTLLTGVFIFLIGRFKLTRVMRALPYPVAGGLIAGTGWLLVKGGFDVATDGAGLSTYSDGAMLLRWVPALLFALALIFILRRYQHVLTMPSIIFGAIIVFYGGLWLAGQSMDAIRADGLLMDLPSGGLFVPLTPDKLSMVDWGLIFGQGGSIATVVAMSTVLLILNINGIEIITRRDVNLNQELERVGQTNVLIGLLGGPVSFQTLSLTALGHRMRTSNRLLPLATPVVFIFTLLAGASALSYFPKPLLGGLLVFLGASFLIEWLIDARLPRRDIGIIVTILLTIAIIGFLEGVLMGVVLAILLFVWDYSNLTIIRHRFSGNTFHSSISRSPEYKRLLDDKGSEIEIFQLQSFIFFGTAHGLYTEIKENCVGKRIVILDLRYVIRLDTSAVFSLSKLQLFANLNNIALLISSVPEHIRPTVSSLNLQEFPDMDHALAFAEKELLTLYGKELAPFSEISAHLEKLVPKSVVVIMRYLVREEMPQGTILARQGDPANELFFVEKGMLGVQLEIDGVPDTRLRTITSGAMVGEAGLYSQAVRSASIVAEEDSVIYRLTREALNRMSTEHPQDAINFHSYIAKTLAERLSDTTEALALAMQ